MQQFENAKVGIGRLFTAEILSLIAEVLIAFAGIFSIFQLATTTSVTSLGVMVIVDAILVVAAVVLAIIALVKMISGVKRAGKDEEGYRNAFVMIICIIIGYVLEAIFKCITNIPSWVNTAPSIFITICEIFMFCYIVSATMRLLDKRGKHSVANKGSMIYILIIGSLVLAIIARLIAAIFSHVTVLALIMAMVALLAILVAYVTYLIFLYQAKNNLAD